MFEFFIALFGGLFWGGKYAKEKSEIKRVQDNNEINQIKDAYKRSEWMSKVTDEELEMQLEAFVFDTANYDKVWAEVAEAYKEMPWENEEFICIYPETVEIAYGKGVYNKKQRDNIAANNRLKALRILLAKRGKLRRCDADWGIPTSVFGGVPLPTERKWLEEETKFMLWITDQLAKHGIEERLYIKQIGNEAFLASSHPCYRGEYVWEPVIPHYFHKHD